MTCLQCDTSDIPSDGLPLETGSSQPQVGPSTLIGDGSAPLAGTGGQTVLNYQFNPRQGGGYYGNGYGSTGGFGSTGYINPYGGYSYRQRRSIRRGPRPISVKLSQKLRAHTRIFQLAPIVKDLHLSMGYSMEYGNSTLFSLGQDNQGRTFIETIDKLERGVYKIEIKGELKDKNSNATKSFQERFGAFNFKTRVAVRVL